MKNDFIQSALSSYSHRDNTLTMRFYALLACKFAIIEHYLYDIAGA